MIEESPTSPLFSTVHLLTVHGVGGHDHLSHLLRTYQSFRANLTSVEAPVTGEDQIPGWRLTQFEEGETPPYLTLEPRVEPPAGAVGAVRLYEVNYSGFAGVVRRNHRIDLTNLFVGLDLAVCAARQRRRTTTASVLPGDTARLAECLQRVAGVLTAGTVPIIGLPAIVFRDYIGTFIATFTRFFEDVASFVLDKNGEQLISAHLDRTMENIARAMKPGDRLVVAAHSLGSVVVHNYIVRKWTAGTGSVPDTVVTFGSPIGLLLWIWLFLDFENMDFQSRVEADYYFCWNPVSRGEGTRKRLSWINVVNCVDPIATAFPVASLDLSAAEPAISAALTGGTIAHRFFGRDKVTSVGAAHNEYLNDKDGFLRILLRASGLASGNPEEVAGTRSAAQHWIATRSVLHKLQWALLGVAALAIGCYCWLVARGFGDYRALWFIPLFVWPPLTIGVLAFFQRLMLGGPTKRIPTALIRGMSWSDVASFPYRLRDAIRRSREATADVDPMAPSPGYVTRLMIRAISFLPTLAAMAIPIAGTAWLTGRWPTLGGLASRVWSFEGVAAFAAFMAYVFFCAGHELARTWRRVVAILT
ncbi:MAG: hypothetical protein HY655_08755 [Acidobacteria bacterium]|nr:hypothetical protein [Acidobacteriota bacterium]